MCGLLSSVAPPRRRYKETAGSATSTQRSIPGLALQGLGEGEERAGLRDLKAMTEAIASVWQPPRTLIMRLQIGAR
jgi:hypothetical protein